MSLILTPWNSISRTRNLELNYKRIQRSIDFILCKLHHFLPQNGSLLSGTMPASIVIAKQKLLFFGKLVSLPEHRIEKRLLIRRMMCGVRQPPKDLIDEIPGFLSFFDLPNADDLIAHPAHYNKWKMLVSSACKRVFLKDVLHGCCTNSSLKVWLPFLDSIEPGMCYVCPLSPRCPPPTFNYQYGYIVRAKLLSGTYPLQTRLRQFNQHNIDPTCPFCLQENETLHHFISVCSQFSPIRRDFGRRFVEIMGSPIDRFCQRTNHTYTDIVLFSAHVCLPQVYADLGPSLFNLTLGFLCRLHSARSTLCS